MKGFYATLTSQEYLYITGEEFLRRLPNAGELLNILLSDKLFIKVASLNDPSPYHVADLFINRAKDGGFPFVFPISRAEYEAITKR